MRTERPSLEDLASVLMGTVTWLRRETKPVEWSAVALSTLDVLDRFGPQRVSDLVVREHITQPGMTGLVSRLEAAGLVERRSDTRDRRASLVSVTESGRAYLDGIRRSRAAVLAEHLTGLTSEQQEALFRAMPALTALTATPATGSAASLDS